MDHSECVNAEGNSLRGHTHEDELGFWLWPDDFRPDGSVKDIYEESPTGAGF